MTKENKQFLKTLLYLALPIVLQEIINSSVNMLDTFMVGKLSVYEMTAVGLGNQIFFLFALLCFGINSGSSIFMGQFWGKKDVASIHKTMGICISFGLVAAILFASAAFIIPEKLMEFYSNDPLVIQYGAKYLRIVCLSYFPFAIIGAVNASLKSCGQTRPPMATSFMALLMNGIFNYIFIFILHKSVQGAAWATVIARMTELIVQLLLVYKLKMPVAGKLKAYAAADVKFLKDFFAIAAPVILNEFTWASGTTLYNVAYKFTGTDGQGAVQISNNIQQLFMVMGLSVGSACGIMLTNCLGAGERDKAIRYSRKCLILSVVLSASMGMLLIAFSPLIVNFFNVSQEVKGLALNILKVIAVGMVFKTFNYTTIVGILRSGGDTIFCFLVDGLSVWLVGVPLAFITAYFIGLPIYWVVAFVYCEEFIKFFISGLRVKRNGWARTLV